MHAGQEVRRHVPHVAGVLEEIAHESFDREHAGQFLVAVQFGQSHLFVARQKILALAGMEVQFIAEPQQELVGLHQVAGDRPAAMRRSDRGFPVRARHSE